ncbi:hypothetical protein [Streptomyces sp. JJ36]|uniref:Thoeris anti-defense Tad2 family protein n=1 Tax=Streptomyces sp. JJ36 TaxID=2736645 RepID=UPI001F18AA3D|nr:hypothetical protein [Streptomyces sp. JJ36]MCF6524997.1 hypothetical protein [Streptomyces sp. JJ36]
MDYSEALRRIRAGGRVSRRSWIQPGKYVYWVQPSETTLPDGSPVELAGHALFYRPAKGARGIGQVEPYYAGPDAQGADDWYDVDAEAGRPAHPGGPA